MSRGSKALNILKAKVQVWTQLYDQFENDKLILLALMLLVLTEQTFSLSKKLMNKALQLLFQSHKLNDKLP